MKKQVLGFTIHELVANKYEEYFVNNYTASLSIKSLSNR